MAERINPDRRRFSVRRYWRLPAPT